MDSAALLLGSSSAAPAAVTVPVGTLTSTLRVGGGRGSGSTATLGGGGDAVIAPDPSLPCPDGSITLGPTLGAVGVVNASPAHAVDAVVRASLSRLRGDYVGALRIAFASGSTQVVGLHARVLRPAIIVGPAALSFGVVRASVVAPRGVSGGSGSARVMTLHLANPTTVPAAWRIRHVPAPALTDALAARSAAAGTSTGLLPHVTTLAGGGGAAPLPWAALGLPPDAAWAQPPPPTAPLDDPSVFAFAATSGLLPGPTAGLEEHASGVAGGALRQTPGLPAPIPLEVRFAPRSPALYRSRFRFSAAHGESFEVLLEGRGAHEET